VHRIAAVTLVTFALSGCASLAVRPCDSIAERDAKYTARFFLGILTLGISEATIQHEQWVQAREGWRFCPPPVGWHEGPPPPGAAALRTPGLLVNATKWTLNVYLDADPGTAGVVPLLTMRPGESRRVALLAGPHRIVARPIVAATDAPSPDVRYERRIHIDPQDGSFRLQLSEREFTSR
jgi:hypothetical protein